MILSMRRNAYCRPRRPSLEIDLFSIRSGFRTKRDGKPFLTAVVLSAILAVAFNPLYSRVGRLVPRASLAAFITTSAAIGPLVIALVFVGMAVNHEIRSGAMADFVRSTGSLAKPLSFDL